MKNRLVNTKFWTDKYIVTLDPDAKLLFLYFLSNQLTNIAGIYEITIRQMVFDTGLTVPTLNKYLKQFQDDNKIYYLFEYGWVYIKNFQKNQTLNPSVITGIAKAIEETPKRILDALEKLDKEFVPMRRSPGDYLRKIQSLKIENPVKGMK